MSTEITPMMWQMLDEAANTFRFSNIDLRFEGGSYIDWLNKLVVLEYLTRYEDPELGYNVAYIITAKGQQALAAYHEETRPPDGDASSASSS